MNNIYLVNTNNNNFFALWQIQESINVNRRMISISALNPEQLKNVINTFESTIKNLTAQLSICGTVAKISFISMIGSGLITWLNKNSHGNESISVTTAMVSFVSGTIFLTSIFFALFIFGSRQTERQLLLHATNVLAQKSLV